MSGLNRLVLVVAAALALALASPAIAAGPSNHTHHGNHGNAGYHAYHGNHHHHHHHHVWSYRGGRWVYVDVVGPVYMVYYRSVPATPWALYASYASAEDADLDAAYLGSKGYEAFVR